MLTVSHLDHVSGQAYWACKCKCGQTTVARGDHLRLGKISSCGCQQGVIHGHSRRDKKAPEYGVWLSMNNRCRNPNANGYHSYGGRGIRVCDRWQESFVAFLEDMGPRPAKGFTIDRRDNSQGYEPDNCYWATPMQQGGNKRTNVVITIGSVSQHAAAWCRDLGIKPSVFYKRRWRGWAPEQALGIEGRA